jgi:hypothetical protein
VAMNLVAVQTSLALGSVIWGTIASAFGPRVALATAATVMFLLHLAYRKVRVAMGNEADVTPAVQLPDLAIAVPPMPDDGPVLIQIEYQVTPEHREEFFKSIQKVEATRRRNGATSWRVFRNVEEDGRFVERYIITSWAEYVRLRTRMTMADRKLQDRVVELQEPDVPIRVSRLIGVDPRHHG